MIGPDTAAGQTIIFLPDRRGQLKLRSLIQMPSDVVSLKLGPSRISNQDFSVVGFDAAIQPAMKCCGKDLVIEHVTQKD